LYEREGVESRHGAVERTADVRRLKLKPDRTEEVAQHLRRAGGALLEEPTGRWSGAVSPLDGRRLGDLLAAPAKRFDLFGERLDPPFGLHQGPGQRLAAAALATKSTKFASRRSSAVSSASLSLSVSVAAPATCPNALRARIRRCRFTVVLPLIVVCLEEGAVAAAIARAIGLDVHLDFCEMAVCEEGKVRSAGQVKRDADDLEVLAESLLATDRVMLAVTGSAWEIARIMEPHLPVAAEAASLVELIPTTDFGGQRRKPLISRPDERWRGRRC
jgi:hypothetical protein